MRRVEAKPLREYLLSGLGDQADLRKAPFFFRRRHLFNPFAFLALLIFVCVVSSPYSRISRVVGASLVCYLAYAYFSTRAIAQGLRIKRKTSLTYFTENDDAEVIIELTNASSFGIPPGLTIEDRFEASLDSLVRVVEGDAIQARTRAHARYRRKCDGGMGLHAAGPLRVKVTDPLGIFEFRVIEDDVVVYPVFPKVTQIPDFPIRGTPSSTSYGAYEVASRGLSVNFSGVRPYTHGDSLRHIAWRVSAKRPDSLLVKEFEKSVDCEVSVVLNLDPLLHVGFKSHSTWETAKDVVLSIVSQQIELGNAVQLISNDFYVEPSRGADHFNLICRALMEATPEIESKTPRVRQDLLRRHRHLISAGSTVFFISVFDTNEFATSLPTILELRDRSTEVFCIFMDPASFLSGLPMNDFYATILRSFKNHPEEQRAAVEKLAEAGVATFIVPRGARLEQVFLSSSRPRAAV